MKKNIKTLGSFIFIVMFMIGMLHEPVYAAERHVDYEEVINKIAEKYVGESVPGACVAISEHGRIVFSKAYGYADLEKKTPMKLDAVFEWGSISKTFIWVSVMQLAEQGKIDMNADIRSYLPKGFLQKLRFDEPVTMMHLMNHTAGFEEQLIDLRYFTENQETSLDKVLSSYQPEQIFVPGEISAYSNWGAALAAFIVERVSGQEYQAYVHEHILLPLNMKNTSMGPFWKDIPNLIERKSKGYSFSGKGFKQEDALHLRMYPAGAMNGSVNDLLRYAQELAKGYARNSLIFKDSNTKRKMFTETYRSYGANAGLSHGFWQYAGNPDILGHEGGTYGFKLQLWVEPKKERVILIATNVMETEFCSEIMNSLVYEDVGKEENKKATPDDCKVLEGEYLPARSAWQNVGKIQGRIMMISIHEMKDGNICLTMPFGNKKQYYRQIVPNIFFCEEASPEEKFLAFNIKNGVVHSMSFRLAHEYVPAKIAEGKSSTLIGLAVYIFMTVLFLISLLTDIFSLLRRRRKCNRHSILIALSGIILGVSGILGMRHWFSIYTVIGYELILIVVTGRICVITGMLSGGYGFMKEKKLKHGILLFLFIAQFLAAYSLGFLTMI